MKSLNDIYFRFREVILYGIIGGFCAALDFGIYSFLGMWMPYLWANVISVHCGIICSFFLNRQFNFKIKDKTALRISIFYIVGLSGLGLSELLIFLFAKRMGYNYIIVKLITVFVVALYQFILNKFITFRKADIYG